MNQTRKRPFLPLAIAVLVGFQGCDFLDPTNVQNPLTTTDDLANAEEPTAALLPGLRAQFARAISAVVSTTENVSDNYSIHGTGINKDFDNPRAVTSQVANGTGTGGGGAYWNIQELRALADFVLEIATGDATATQSQIAEARYYRGVALVMLAENFSAAPVELDGAALSGRELLTLAVTELQGATGSGSLAHATLARAYRLLGDAANAVSSANSALALGDGFYNLQEYDAATLTNTPHAFLVTRALQEMQPLPRLDFLDPKFLSRAAGIAYAKGEEMYLIKAEAAFAGGDFVAGRAELARGLRLALSRGTTSFIDNDQRLNADLSIRPRDAAIKVRADDESPIRSGLVLNRNGSEVAVPELSSTSLDPDSVAAIPVGDTDALWHALHLARQEILFLEGRRMSDLGIRLPMMQREIDANPNINPGGPGTEPVVPGYIPAGETMDFFTPASPYGPDGTLLTDVVTVNVDMNKVLVANGVSPFLN